jgi:internalin A
MECVQRTKQLKRLDLANTQVTNKTLEHLESLPELDHLVLTNTLVTDDGVMKLQQALPNCTIERLRGASDARHGRTKR